MNARGSIRPPYTYAYIILYGWRLHAATLVRRKPSIMVINGNASMDTFEAFFDICTSRPITLADFQIKILETPFDFKAANPRSLLYRAPQAARLELKILLSETGMGVYACCSF
jgi:hypothetical protein